MIGAMNECFSCGSSQLWTNNIFPNIFDCANVILSSLEKHEYQQTLQDSWSTYDSVQ